MFRHLQANFFQSCCDDREHKARHSDIGLDDLDLHSRSQLFEKSKTPLSIFLEIPLLIWTEFKVFATTSWFVEAHAKFILHK